MKHMKTACVRVCVQTSLLALRHAEKISFSALMKSISWINQSVTLRELPDSAETLKVTSKSTACIRRTIQCPLA